MKNPIFTFLLVILLAFTPFFLCAQDNEEEELPHATIHVFKSSRALSYEAYLRLKNQNGIYLPPQMITEVKLYSSGNIYLEIFQNTGNTEKTWIHQLKENIEVGKDYYFVFDRQFPDPDLNTFRKASESEFKEMAKDSKTTFYFEENLDFPINRRSIQDIYSRKGQSQGTCFLLNDQGYLLTNYHCVEDAKEIKIKGIGGDFSQSVKAKIIGTDASNDLAVIQLEGTYPALSKPPYGFRTAKGVQAEKIYALGFPKAQSMGENMKITDGIISSTSGVKSDISNMQISAPVNPGNSGGPLIDEEGNVLGVIYAKLKESEAVGYAVKNQYVEAFLQNLDGITLPQADPAMKSLSFPDKIARWKDFVYIIEVER